MKLSPSVLALVAAMSAGCASGGASAVVHKPTAVVPAVAVAATPPPSQPEPDPVPMTDPDPDWMAACGRG